MVTRCTETSAGLDANLGSTKRVAGQAPEPQIRSFFADRGIRELDADQFFAFEGGW